jgi:hypothetical protein
MPDIGVKEASMPHMTIELPSEIAEMLAQTAANESVHKMEVLRRMFTVLKITQEEKRKGNDLGIVHGDKVVARFVGI